MLLSQQYVLTVSVSLHRVYCGICIERLCGREELERVQQAETWECYLCSREHAKLGLLCKRDNWLDMLKDLFSNDYEVEYVCVLFIYSME